MTEDMFEEEEEKNWPISVYIPKDARAKIEKLLPEMGFDNMHAFLQHAALYFASEWQKDPSILEKEKKPKKPEV